jgi:hypothetical protein
MLALIERIAPHTWPNRGRDPAVGADEQSGLGRDRLLENLCGVFVFVAAMVAYLLWG